jgi:hypothetical protein
VGDFVLAHQQTSGGKQQFKNQLGKNRLVWGDRPCRCSACGKTLYYNYIGDIFHYLGIKHPVLSVLLVPKLHPYSRGERAATLAIGLLFSFFISVVIQDPDLSTLAAVVITILSFVAEQLATCSCAQKPGLHWCLRETIEHVGNIIQISMLLAALMFAWGGAKIFSGKNGNCFAVNGTSMCPTLGTHLCQNASFYARPTFVSFTQTLDCANSACQGKCLLPASLNGLTPVLVQQAMSLGQSWVVIWPLAHIVTWSMKHRKERKSWAQNADFYAATSGDTAGIVATEATQNAMCVKCTKTWGTCKVDAVTGEASAGGSVARKQDLSRLERGLQATGALKATDFVGSVSTDTPAVPTTRAPKELPPLQNKQSLEEKLQRQQEQEQQQQQQREEKRAARESRKLTKEPLGSNRQQAATERREQAAAAQRMQAIQRGRNARNAADEQQQAAAKMQAVQRGRKSRREKEAPVEKGRKEQNGKPRRGKKK